VKKDDYTDMGGVGQAFLTTHWSLIRNISSKQDNKDRALIGSLLNRYWKPVYCYLRRKGYNNEEAKDLTQGFFHEVVLSRNLFEKAEQSKGRFRSFLLIALNRYLINIHHEQTAQKRIPKEKLVPLDIAESPELPQVVAKLNPEESFNYAWVSSLLEDVLKQVETQCHEDGKTVHWKVFNDRILQPIIEGSDSPSMKEICDRYGIEDESMASNMIVTAKRRFQAALKNWLRNSVVSESDIENEFAELKKFFPKIAQD
jgi:DNA-directed RNA polymerase specialized sigma24 family protein